MRSEKKIEVLKKAADRKRQDALERTNKAITTLVRKSQPITFAAVAQEAGVSTAYLYKYPELKDRINHLKSQQEGNLKTSKTQPASDKSRLVIVNTLRERVKKLEEQNAKLNEQNKAIYGRLCQLQSIHQEAEALRKQNVSLKAENDWLKQQLEQKSSFAQDSILSLATGSKAVFLDKTQVNSLGLAPRICQALASINLELNSTLIRTIKSVPEEIALTAIEALKEALEVGYIERPGGWLNRAIEESWKPNEKVNKQIEPQMALFNQWFNLARNKGIVVASIQEEDGQIYVFDQEGVRLSFEQMRTKYPLEGFDCSSKADELSKVKPTYPSEQTIECEL